MENKTKSISINGKNQMVELLKALPSDHKETLLKNIRLRNVVVGRELTEKSFTFQDIFHLSDENIRKGFSAQNSTILAMSLYPCKGDQQKRILRFLERNKAVEVFQTLSSDLGKNINQCLKAQRKIVTNFISLSRRGYLTLN